MNQTQNTRRNPWEYQSFGKTVQVCDAASRIAKLDSMTVSELADAMAWPGTQKTVRDAARREMDKRTGATRSTRLPRGASPEASR